MKYSDIKLNENIKKALAELGYENMTKIQELSYEDILSGKDIVGMSSTGSGKTAAFMIPTIENIQIDNKSTQVLVITPTRELAIQIVQETRKYLKYTQGINALAIYATIDGLLSYWSYVQNCPVIFSRSSNSAAPDFQDPKFVIECGYETDTQPIGSLGDGSTIVLGYVK